MRNDRRTVEERSDEARRIKALGDEDLIAYFFASTNTLDRGRAFREICVIRQLMPADELL